MLLQVDQSLQLPWTVRDLAQGRGLSIVAIELPWGLLKTILANSDGKYVTSGAEEGMGRERDLTALYMRTTEVVELIVLSF